jgi:putative oxidoreductase
MRSIIFSIRRQSVAVDIILLLMRLVVGYAFFTHGSMKIHDPMHWMGKESSFAGIFQALAAISEYYGGIALMLGIFTRIAAFGIACTMVVAIYEVHFVLAAPFINFTGGLSFELPTVFLLIMLLFIISGPGRFSLDRLIFGIRL